MAQDQGFEQYRKSTRRDQFLETMDRIVPWAALCAAVESFYPKPGSGRPQLGLEGVPPDSGPDSARPRPVIPKL